MFVKSLHLLFANIPLQKCTVWLHCADIVTGSRPTTPPLAKWINKSKWKPYINCIFNSKKDLSWWYFKLDFEPKHLHSLFFHLELSFASDDPELMAAWNKETRPLTLTYLLHVNIQRQQKASDLFQTDGTHYNQTRTHIHSPTQLHPGTVTVTHAHSAGG